MKKFILFLVSFLIGLALFIWVLEFVGWQDIKYTARIFFSWQGAVLVFLTFLMAVVGTWKWREILKGLGVKISSRALFGPYLAGYAVMFLMPVIIWGSEILRGYFLKEKKSVPWPKGMASVLIDRIFEWTTNLVVIVFGISFFLSEIYFLPPKLELVFGTVFLIFAFVIIYFYFKVFRKESMVESIGGLVGLKKIEGKNSFSETEKEIFNFFRIKNGFMWRAFALSFVRTGVMLLRVWILIFFLGGSMGSFYALSILGFNYLAVMIPIPTALGSHEAIQTFAFGALGLKVSSATVFTMLIRGAELLISLVGLMVLFKFGMDFIKKFLFKKIDKLISDSGENYGQP
ncbi:MAG: lysylphosphatidylglycerol synthase transmembrane domain-containing protein [Patescibacteria group bacterium]